MRRILGLEQLSTPLDRSVVTIGKFFAIHRGHQALLRATVEAARAREARSVAVTFDRHPAEILRPGLKLPVLADLDERLDLMEELELDVALVIRLTPEFLSLTPQAFVREVLVERLHAVEVLASDNFRFGRGAAGTLQTLRELGEKWGFGCRAVPPVSEGGERISSSRIQASIEAGNVHEAALLLGRPYSLHGTVVPGDQVGRRLGFPTANVRTAPERLLPRDGVYMGRLAWDDDGAAREVPAVINLGVRPTRDGHRRVLEAHLLDWSGDLYGRTVRIRFLDRLRDEQRFPDLNALRDQIARDVAEARARLAAASKASG